MIEPKDPRYKDLDIITLELEEGGVLDCLVISIFDVNAKQYVALLPMNPDGSVDDDAEIYLYGYIEGKGEDCELLDIEDDEEYEIVAECFESMLEGE